VPDPCEAFDRLVDDINYPMYVVTAAAGDERDGCLVGFATQSSIKPPQFAVWLSKQNRTYRIACDTSILAVHLLRRRDLALAEHFGSKTADDGIDKLIGIDWHPGPGGVPIVAGCDWFAGRTLQRLDVGGDHEGFVLDPIDGSVERAGTPQLGFQHAKNIQAGHPA
jgi:flavin reductase (DIM6/NTAB) family NADH-FMN oxidoreductase RutF